MTWKHLVLFILLSCGLVTIDHVSSDLNWIGRATVLLSGAVLFALCYATGLLLIDRSNRKPAA